MDKTTDRRNNTAGTKDDLEPEKCRARIEVSLMRAAADTCGGAGAFGIFRRDDQRWLGLSEQVPGFS